MDYRSRNEKTLATLNPEFAAKIRQILNAMEVLNSPMLAYDGLRTLQEQKELFAKGRTTPGKIVTNADGVIKKSYHQSGNAVDCVFVTETGINWDGPWELYMQMGELLGLTAGGRWKGLVDKPHLEMR